MGFGKGKGFSTPPAPPAAPPFHQLDDIDPENFSLVGGPEWQYKDLSRNIPEGATGAILQIYNADDSAYAALGLRKPGANYESIQPLEIWRVTWVIVGLDDQRRFEYKFGPPSFVNGYVLGYTGPDVVFPDDPIDIKPAVNNAYSTLDIKATWPEAVIILSDLGSSESFNEYHSIRPDGSTKEIFQGDNRCWPFCGVPENGKIQTKLSNRAGASTQWLAYAYFKKDCTISLNGVDQVGFTSNAWKTLSLGTLHPDERWAFLEYQHPYGTSHVSVRKQHSYYDLTGRNSNHGYFITGLDADLECQVYSGTTAAADQLLHIAESH